MDASNYYRIRHEYNTQSEETKKEEGSELPSSEVCNWTKRLLC